MLGLGVIAPTMPLYARTMGASGIWLGLIYAAFSMSRALFMPLVGNLSDKRGRKSFIVIGLALYMIISLGYVWSTRVLQLVWLRFMHGVGSAMVIPIAMAMVGDIAPEGQEGRIMGRFQVALFLGFGGGPLISGMVMGMWGLSEVFYVMGGMCFIALLLVVFFLAEKPRSASYSGSDEKASFLALWRTGLFKGIWAFRFSNAVGRASVIAFLPVLASAFGVSPEQIGILVSVNILVTGGLQSFFGVFADRFSRKKLVITGNVISALSFFMIPLAGNFLHLILLGILMGLGGALAFPAAAALATEAGRIHGMGNVMGNFNMAMSIGGIIGAVFSGWMMDLLGITFVFIFGGVTGLAGSLACWFWLGGENRNRSSGSKIYADI